MTRTALFTAALVIAVVRAPGGVALAQGFDTPPSTPAGARAQAYGPASGGIAWRRSSDDRGVVGYEVSRDGVVLGVRDALSYIERDLAPGRGYDYAVVAIDTAGQRSGRATVRLVTPDAHPAVPVGLRANVYSRTAAGLAWNRPGVPGLRYEVRRDGEVVATTGGTSHVDTGLSDRRAYLFEVIALNRQGERSRAARLLVRTGQGVASALPTPTGLRAALYSATAAGIAWDRSELPRLSYEVRRDGELLATSHATSYIDKRLTGGRSYTYEVVALDAEGRRRSTPARIMLNTPAGDGPPGRASSVIGVDTHVELLRHVFDVYTGNAYGPAVLALPGYSAVPEPPNYPDHDRSFAVSTTCENGGTAGFDRIYWGDFSITAGWVHDFDGCQDGADVLDGRLSVADTGGGRFVSSPGFTLDTPVGRTRFRGNVHRIHGGVSFNTDLRYWWTSSDTPYFTPNAHDPSAAGIDFVRTDAQGNVTFELLDARTFFSHEIPRYRSLSGGFSVRSEATGGERLEVRVLEELYQDGHASPEFLAEFPSFETGVLRISAANGDTLVLDAATGERETVRIDITVDGVIETLTQPWSLWRDRLEFDEAFLGDP